MNQKTFPTLLSKSDAMLHAADQLEAMVGTLKLIAIFREVSKRPGMQTLDAENQKALEELKAMGAGIVDVDLQERAMREAAKEIRAMATEQKLVEARAAASGIRV